MHLGAHYGLEVSSAFKPLHLSDIKATGGSVGGLQLHAIRGAGIVLNGTKAAEWENQAKSVSGNTQKQREFYQTNATYQPTVDNGYLDFDKNTPNRFEMFGERGSGFVDFGDFCFFIVITPKNLSVNNTFFGSSTGSNNFIRFQNNGTKIRFRGKTSGNDHLLTLPGGVQLEEDELNILMLHRDAEDVTVKLVTAAGDVTSTLTHTDSNTSFESGIEINRFGVQAGLTSPFDGILHEIVMYDYPVSSADQDEILNILALRHNIHDRL
jgi:hypothetical protein